jgi:hypothetical protein
MTALNGEPLRRIHLQDRYGLPVSKEHAAADLTGCETALPVMQ